MQLLVPGKGKAAIVVPQSILNNPGLEYVRQWLFAHTKILGVVELPVETFLISGREGTGTLTAILLIERRPLEETVQILNDAKRMDNYPIFMAIANYVGYDRRGNRIFIKDDEGQEIYREYIVNSNVMREKIVNNELPQIVEEYLTFRNKLQAGKVYYDFAEEVYCVL